ncbi:MAG: hypothetical protein L3J35_01895 [Bacteroidales bacterium]|nr:hypothetical protein [Bacteroidales bacterium]
MNIDLNIYQSIIFGELRPWLNKLNEDAHKQILPQYRQKETYTSIEDLNNSLSKIVKNNPLISKSDTFTIETFPTNDKPKTDYSEIFEHLIYIDLPKADDKLTKYYKQIISAEAIRLISTLNKALNFYNKEQAKYPVLQFIEQIEQYQEETEKHINNTAHQTDFIFKTLYTTLVKIRLEVQNLYPELITSKKLSENDLLKHFPNLNSITSKLNHFKIHKLLKINKFEMSEALGLIETIRYDYIKFNKNNSSEKEQIELNEVQIQNIRTLENIICIDVLGKLKGNQNILTHLEQKNIESIKPEYQDKIISELEKTDSPANRTSLISKELDKFSFLNSNHIIENPKLELSLPRELRTWLNKIEETYKVNPNYNPADLLEITKIKTNLNTYELAYLFRIIDESGVLEMKDKKELCRGIANVFETKQMRNPNLDTDSIYNKFYTKDDKAVENMHPKFKKMQEIAFTDKKNIGI